MYPPSIFPLNGNSKTPKDRLPPGASTSFNGYNYGNVSPSGTPTGPGDISINIPASTINYNRDG